MKKIIFATSNADKMKEIREIYQDLPVEILSMKEVGLSVDIEENGSSFEENALIKASTIAQKCGEIVMADDSGLEVDALNKEPGIYSARYMGEDTSYHVKNANIIQRLEGVEEKDRSARFVCAIACVAPNKESKVVRATIEGYIGYEEKGENGFGYDPIFIVPEYGCSSAELSREQKNEISHRGKALGLMKEYLMEFVAVH